MPRWWSNWAARFATPIESGILPVIKHMPGHGRAGADSH
jgi:beta-glucosidase-like glycosyl hydrolase